MYVSPQDYQSLLNQVTTQEASVMGEDALLVTLSNGIIYTARYPPLHTHRRTHIHTDTQIDKAHTAHTQSKHKAHRQTKHTQDSGQGMACFSFKEIDRPVTMERSMTPFVPLSVVCGVARTVRWRPARSVSMPCRGDSDSSHSHR